MEVSIVFTSKDINIPWNGSSFIDDKIVSADVYMYKITIVENTI